ncbi:Ribosomal protein L7/L12 [Macleaya cordata]|uniref:Ribosomal protein L7/L12 n=1 Tax=Macleaya cordata TaxID=56857 RepID=A0A200QE99_MACCD|nr:Ribosomal protein L7/L12 [Macleaya cordata]OVA08727.1 Ribosomal protein L7/L12 [Macleaya cordata]
MRYFHYILNTSRNPNFYSRAHKDHSFLGFLRSKSVLYSTYSFSNLFRKSDVVIPNERSWNRLSFAPESTSTGQETKLNPSERVSVIVDEISGLTLLEVADLTEVLRKKLNVNEMPIMTMMMPGMGIGGKGAGKGGGASKTEEKKAEKTAFDLKLEGFDAAAKIKIIKEVRTFTDLGLKEAKDLVEKAPTLLKKGVPKEEAEKIIEKMKEVGAKVVME